MIKNLRQLKLRCLRVTKTFLFWRASYIFAGFLGICTSSFYCWFLHEVTYIQTTKLSILPRFYFHDVLEQLKTNFHTNFRFKRVLGFVIEYAWISKLLRDAAFTWRPRELSCRLKKWLISGNFCYLNSSCIRKSITLMFMSFSNKKFTLL